MYIFEVFLGYLILWLIFSFVHVFQCCCINGVM